MILHFINTGPAAGPVLVGLRNRGAAAAAPVPATARGNIDFDQLRVAARTGNGLQLLTWNLNPPAVHSSTGVAGQIAYDSSGNFFWCYSTNAWARIGPGGYSSSF
jgi:hypothetical protein